MYEEGPDVIRAKSPGYQIREAMSLFRWDMASAKKDFYEGFAEALERCTSQQTQKASGRNDEEALADET